MQLQPFRRSSIISAGNTRDFLVSYLPIIRANYTNPKPLVITGPPSRVDWPESGAQSIHVGANTLAPTMTVTTPQIGDLHDWDKLVDGCLYYDSACTDRAPYLIRFGGDYAWTSHESYMRAWDAINPGDPWSAAPANTRALKALVLASGIKSREDFIAAIEADISRRGGAR